MPTTKRHYGHIPDEPDPRDLHLMVERPDLAIPAQGLKVSLRSKMPPVFDQGQLGSCTANAIVAAVMYTLGIQTMLSRLFVYWAERLMEGTVQQDAGAQIRDGVKVVATQGAAPESLWPYVIAKFKKRPSAKAFTAALLMKIAGYHRVTGVDQIRAALAAGLPVIAGFTVYQSFESQEVASSGVLNLPAPGEPVVGGHAILIVGCDDAAGRWEVRNSWGLFWGQQGYFTMPYAYQLTDCWTLAKAAA